MLELAVQLAQRQASGESLSAPETALSDITWVGTQVFMNGFLGWLAYTSCDRMCRTLAGLAAVGCTDLATNVREALSVAGVDPERFTDEEREKQIEALTEDDLDRLGLVDGRFDDLYEPSMVLCRQYAQDNGALHALEQE